ncbi:hypothetical protein [Cardinium endosymbiont of Culicoides punctatus]|uniref:hypothetical protein n=1 Tax=Cardinium endosymbiont of Culicoides punctatus TaxID=2304601 RepID=UPI001058F51C|nr:hypothetical protein [Cardinium endosymbiont of Culicoides punctatus]
MKNLKLPTRDCHVGHLDYHEVLYGLSTLRHIDEVTNLVGSIIVDPTQQPILEKDLRDLYAQYVSTAYEASTHEVDYMDNYLSYVNQFLHKNKEKLDQYLMDMCRFYGTNTLPFNTIKVYACRPSYTKEPGTGGRSFAIYNHIFLDTNRFPCCDDCKRSRISTVLHEVAHILYRQQDDSVQYAINRAFRASTSPYAGLAHHYFNEALATAIQGYFEEVVDHKTNAIFTGYNNRYIQEFAHILLPMVKTYMQKKRCLDVAFVQKAIQLFASTFPNSKYELPLFGKGGTPVLMYKEFDGDEIFNISHVALQCNRFQVALLDDTKEIMEDMRSTDHYASSPIFFTLKPQEVPMLENMVKKNPYLKQLSAVQRAFVGQEPGVYIVRTKTGRPYLFFVADSLKDIETLFEKLEKEAISDKEKYLL